MKRTSLIVACFACLGCQSLASALEAGKAGFASVASSLGAPRVCATRLGIGGLGLSGATLNVILDVYNPNPFHIVARSITLGVGIEGNHVGNVSVNQGAGLRAGGHSEVVVPFSFRWADVGAPVRAAVSRLAAGDPLGYQVSGRVVVNTPAGDVAIPLQYSGQYVRGSSTAQSGTACG